jgi:RHS repeat-associated protein
VLKTTTNAVTGISSSAGYDAGDQLSSYSHDSVTGTSTTFTYDQADELTGYTSGSTTASYCYDGTGLRMSKTVNGTTTKGVWDLAEGLPTIVQDGSTKEITGPGALPIEQVASDGTVLYYLQDQLGSTRGLTDSSGTLVGTFSYDAYGNLTSSTGTATTPFGYTGQYTDSESGLQYLRARYYDPQTAQFVSVDPLVSLTQSPYGYTPGDPLNFDDPMGLWGIGDAGNFVQQHADTIVAVGYVGAVGVAATCAFVTLGACVALDVAVGGAFFGGGVLAASTLLPPGEGMLPDDSACPFSRPEDLPGLPADWSARRADNGKGWVYQAPGPHLNQNSDSYRVMEPTDKYPNGYVRFYNKHGQPIRADGKPGSQAETHFPVDWSGPWPKGPWNEH